MRRAQHIADAARPNVRHRRLHDVGGGALDARVERLERARKPGARHPVIELNGLAAAPDFPPVEAANAPQQRAELVVSLRHVHPVLHDRPHERRPAMVLAQQPPGHPAH